jgi:hypothetical protein
VGKICRENSVKGETIKQFDYLGLHEKVDIVMKLRDDRKLVISSQTKLNGGGQQANRAGYYLSDKVKGYVEENGDIWFIIDNRRTL